MGNLKIRIINKMKTSTHFMLYQEDINLNVKNFKVGAWRHGRLAYDSIYNTVLSQDVKVYSMVKSELGVVKTKRVGVDYGNVLEIFDNKNALDIRLNPNMAATENTMEVFNLCKSSRDILVERDGRPLFMCEVRPDYKVNFSINPKIYIGLCDFQINSDLFDAASMSNKFAIDYEGQDYLTIFLLENESSGTLNIKYDFNKF